FPGACICMSVENVVVASGDERNRLRLGLDCAIDDRRRVRVLGEKIVPGFEHDGVHQKNLSRHLSGLLEVSFRSFADIYDRNMFDWSERWRPRHRDRTHPKRGKNSPASNSCGTDLMGCSRAHLGCTFGPGVWNLEALAVHAVGSGHAKSLHAPLHGVLHGWSAWDSTANLVGQAPKVLLDRRRLKRGLNDFVDVVVVCGGICGENSYICNANKEQGLHSSHIVLH